MILKDVKKELLGLKVVEQHPLILEKLIKSALNFQLNIINTFLQSNNISRLQFYDFCEVIDDYCFGEFDVFPSSLFVMESSALPPLSFFSRAREYNVSFDSKYSFWAHSTLKTHLFFLNCFR